ncbi:hypothetical protein ABH922_002436 [Rhodococcus sp. 27YEA15]|uniref:hypothetical protein n=1 Tax=Rhodococcus sp. 27YEA15 TaxID=3156259 RepID=UPI003C7B3C1F
MTLRGLIPALVAAVVVAVVVVAGITHPVPAPLIRTDVLGPDNGEPVAAYLDRADDSLSAVDGSAWALVSFAEAKTADDVVASTADVRVSQVLYRVPMDRVLTPLASVKVSGSEVAIRRSAATAATQLATAGGADDRQVQVVQASVRALSSGCACAVAVVVRGTSAALEALAAEPGIRAVEAMAHDGVPWLAAVRPLLPEYVDVVAAGPDDGPVP